jgi:hypothetical protein
MPKAITTDFLSRLPKLDFEGSVRIAQRDQAFNWSDGVTVGLPSRRFVQGGRLRDRWFIWYQQGGFAPYSNIFTYRLEDVNTKAVSLDVAKAVKFEERPCEVLVDFLHSR